MSLLAVGTVAFDDITTPNGRAEKVIGGAATYICYAASFFTQDIRISAIIGDDWPAEEIKNLQDRGVDTEGLEIKHGRKSFYWEGKYLDNMNDRETIVTDLNVLDEFTGHLPDSYLDTEYVMLGNLTPKVQLNVMSQLTKPKFVALDTMNFWIDVALDELKEAIAKCDLLIINDEEARMLSGENSLLKSAEIIHNMGPKYVIVKKGENGCLLFKKGAEFFAPAYPLANVVDPTGAGDSFAGGLMGYLASTDDTSWDNLKRAVICGSATASFDCEDFSLDRLRTLTNKELWDRIRSFKTLVDYEF